MGIRSAMGTGVDVNVGGRGVTVNVGDGVTLGEAVAVTVALGKGEGVWEGIALTVGKGCCPLQAAIQRSIKMFAKMKLVFIRCIKARQTSITFG